MRLVWAVVIAGCGRVGFAPVTGDSAVTDDVIDAAAARCSGTYSWSAPALIAELATPADEYEPAIRPDNQTLAFGSLRVSHSIYLSTLQGAVWSAPTLALDAPACDTQDPQWNASGTRLYFARRCTTLQLMVADYTPGTGFGPATLLPGIAAVNACGPTISRDELELFYTDEDASPYTIGHATRLTTTDAWTNHGVDPDFDLQHSQSGFPNLAGDDTTVYVDSDDDPSAAFEIFGGTRAGHGPFVAFAPVPELVAAPGVNSGDSNFAWDCESLYFASDRPGGAGGYDLYVVRRTN